MCRVGCRGRSIRLRRCCKPSLASRGRRGFRRVARGWGRVIRLIRWTRFESDRQEHRYFKDILPTSGGIPGGLGDIMDMAQTGGDEDKEDDSNYEFGRETPERRLTTY